MALALVAPACSSSPGPAQPPAAGAASPRDYARSVCLAVGEWSTRLDRRSDRLPDELASVASVEQARDVLVRFMADLLASTEDLLGAVDQAGHPDVPGGRALAGDLRRGLDRARAVFASGQVQAEGLPVDDRGAFQAAATRLSAGIQAASGDVDAAIRRLPGRHPSPALDDAFAEEDACTSLGQG